MHHLLLFTSVMMGILRIHKMNYHHRPAVVFKNPNCNMHLGLVTTKPVFRVSDKVSHKLSQLRRLARKLKFHLFQKANNKDADQSAPLLFANTEDKFSCVKAHLLMCIQFLKFCCKCYCLL